VLAVGLQCYGLLPRPRWGGLDENLRHVAWQYAPVALGALLTSSSVVVDPLMAASLGSGNVSVLNYGNKIVALVVSVVAVSLSTVLFPRFSRLITLGRWRELRRTLRVYATAVVIGSIPGLIVLGLVSEPLIRLLFERGAFAAETTQAVAQVQIWLLPQVPLAVLVMLGYRMLSALGSNSIVLGLGVLSLALNVGGNWLLMQWFGVTGIAMSTSLTILIVAIATLAVVRYKLGQAEAAAPEPSEQ